MPSRVVLHVGHALALDRASQDHGGLVLTGGCLLQRGGDGGIVVAVHVEDVPVEGLKLFVQRLGGHDVGSAAVDLEAVYIHDGAQVIQMVFGRGHGRFPHLALLDLAVAEDGVDPVIPVVHLAGEGHADGGGDPLPQGAGGHVHAGNVLHVRMAGIVVLDRAEELAVLYRKVALQGQHRVESGRAVALGEDQTVPIRVLRVLGVYPHRMEIQGRQVHHGQGAADMAEAAVWTISIASRRARAAVTANAWAQVCSKQDHPFHVAKIGDRCPKRKPEGRGPITAPLYPRPPGDAREFFRLNVLLLAFSGDMRYDTL